MNLFAYGTLMWPEVLEAVIGRRLQGIPVTLPGYVRLRVKREHYPAIVAAEGDRVEGILYRGLTAPEFARLDRFEGEEYDRRIERAGGAEVQVYVLSDRWKHLAEPVAWNPEDLSPNQLQAFRQEYKGWKDA